MTCISLGCSAHCSWVPSSSSPLNPKPYFFTPLVCFRHPSRSLQLQKHRKNLNRKPFLRIRVFKDDIDPQPHEIDPPQKRQDQEIESSSRIGGLKKSTEAESRKIGGLRTTESDSSKTGGLKRRAHAESSRLGGLRRRAHAESSRLGGLRRRTQAELLERIALEVRQKREGDRESTPSVRALTWACRWVTVPAEVETLVSELDFPLSIFTSTLQKLGIEGKPQAAMAVFQWLQTAPGLRSNVYTYNSLLGALKANRCFEMAQSVYLQMQVNSVTPDVVTYNTLISLYEQQGLFDAAVHVYYGFRGVGLQPTLFTFRTVIQILGKQGDLETALVVFSEFKQQQQEQVGRNSKEESGQVLGLKREAEQQQQLERIMTKLCCENFKELISQERGKKKGGRALQFLNRMRDSQVHLDAKAYEQLMLACGGEGEEDHKIVKMLCRQMRQQQARMNVDLCNHVIQVLGLGKKWWAAMEVYDHMVLNGPEPNAFTYRLIGAHFHVLLTAARNRAIWKWSLQLLDKMIEKGVEPNQFAWNAALIACAKAGQTAAAVLVFQKMTERGQRPGIVSYGALLSALEKSQSLVEAELVWEHMRKVGRRPNIVAYTTMISLYGKLGKYSEAMQLVKEMREAGIEPSVITFNALITACARAGDGERALDLMEQMKAAWIQPDAVSYAQLIEALANEGRWDPARAAYAKMLELELKPPAYTYDTVLRVCKANNIDLHLQPSTHLAKAKVLA